MCVCGGAGMQAMLCVHGICLVLKAVGWKNECSCIGRRRNAYSILCPQMWISLERDVRWGRHILNTCFYICIFLTRFGDSLAPHSLSLFCPFYLTQEEFFPCGSHCAQECSAVHVHG